MCFLYKSFQLMHLSEIPGNVFKTHQLHICTGIFAEHQWSTGALGIGT